MKGIQNNNDSLYTKKHLEPESKVGFPIVGDQFGVQVIQPYLYLQFHCRHNLILNALFKSQCSDCTLVTKATGIQTGQGHSSECFESEKLKIKSQHIVVHRVY